MIIRPQTEIPNIQTIPAAASVAVPAPNGSSSRFDAALLQAAQAIRESAPEGPANTVSSKVLQALETALAQMVQEPMAQVQNLAQQPRSLKAITSGAAQADGLSTAETAQLNDLLALALPKLLAYKSNVEVPGSTAAQANSGGAQPGPQGGTPAVTASPADFFAAGNAPSLPAPQGAPAQPNKQGSAPGPATAAAGLVSAAVPAPIPAIQQGQSQAPAQSTAQASGVSGPVQASAPQQATVPFALPQADGSGAPLRVISVASNWTQGSAAQPQSGPQPQPNAAPVQPSGAPAAQGQASAAAANGTPNADSNTAPAAAAAQGAQQQAGTAPSTAAPSGLPDFGGDMQVSYGEAAAPLQALPGSQVTLKGDGSWVLPEATAAQGRVPLAAPAATSQAVPAVQAPQQGTVQPQAQFGQAAPAQAPASLASAIGEEEALPGEATQAPQLPQVSLGQASGTWTQAPQAAEGQQAPVGQAASGNGTQAPQQANGQAASGNGTQAPQPANGQAASGSGTQAPQQAGAQASVSDPNQSSDITDQADPAQAGAQANGQAATGNGTQAPQLADQTGPAAPGQTAAQFAQLQAPAQPQGTPALPQAQGQAASQAQQQGAAAENGNSGNAAGPQPQLRSSQPAGSFTLAAIGQNPVKSLADQAVQDYGLQKGVTQQVSDALDTAVGAGPGKIVIQLKPANLGEVQISLTMVDGKLTARIIASQPEVRDVLARDLAGFKAGLESHGVVVNEVSVAVGTGMQDRQQGSPQQAAPQWWRGAPKLAADETAGTPASVYAYAATGTDGLQGFSALA